MLIETYGVLNDIIELQRKHQKLVEENHNFIFNTKEEMIQKYMSYIIGETDEVNREVNYKHWKKKKDVEWNKVHEELADIFIFWLDLITKLDIEDEMFEIIQMKQIENIERQKGNIKGREDYKGE